jgi:hypothetical protein
MAAATCDVTRVDVPHPAWALNGATGVLCLLFWLGDDTFAEARNTDSVSNHDFVFLTVT